MEKFQENARVVFYGDSLTHSMKWVDAVYQAYLDQGFGHLRIYNAGFSGGMVRGAWIYREDLYRFQPTHVQLMFGVNDIGIPLWTEPADEERLTQREQRIKEYEKYYRLLIGELLEKGIRVTLATPPPYDTLAETNAENVPLAATAVARCAEIVRNLAKEFDLELIDFHQSVSCFNEQLRQRNPVKSLIGLDRVHPTPTGYAVLAQLFLHEQGFAVPLPTVDEMLEDRVPMYIGQQLTERFDSANALRQIIALEWMVFTQYDATFPEKPAEEKISAMEDYIRRIQTDPKVIDYFRINCPRYVAELTEYDANFQRVLEKTEAVLK